MMNEINLRCRSCNGHSIFIGTGGHLTCSYVDCKEPIVERQFAQLEAENERHLGKIAELVVECERTHEKNERLELEVNYMEITIGELRKRVDALKEASDETE